MTSKYASSGASEEALRLVIAVRVEAVDQVRGSASVKATEALLDYIEHLERRCAELEKGEQT
jgi:hypothetical protein